MKIRLILFVFLLGCTNSDEELIELKKLQHRCDSLNIIIKILENTLNEYQNGAEIRLSQIRESFEKKEFSVLFALADTLKKYHPTSKEYNEAKNIITSANSLIEKERNLQLQEFERQKKETLKSERDKAREFIRVKYVRTTPPNSAGGVDLSIYWQNRSKKIIKYIWFDVVAYNEVGDPVDCSIRGSSHILGQETGPFTSGSWNGDYNSWTDAWYDYSIVKAKLYSVKIEYMDGTYTSIEKKDIGYIQY